MRLFASTDLYCSGNQVQVCLTQPDGRFGYGLCEIELDGDVDKGDWVYMIIVTYTTGSTFGCDSGRKAFGAITTNADKAFSLAQAFQDHEQRINSSEWRSKPHTFDEKYQMTFEGVTYDVGQWTGYFESIDSVDVMRVAVGA